QFVGVDLSRRQVADGQAIVDDLGLSNLHLIPGDILEVADDLGRFDYIICHGVYSWVPEAGKDQILEICARHLAPDGGAYVSYNTYPGWSERGMVREMLSYHARSFDRPGMQVNQARALLDFLIQAAAGREDAFALALREEGRLLRECPDSYLY